ncbi:MAG: pyridoxamine 5'-phosphate oxidase family protein [Flavobacteriaceae bacterium]
MTENKITSTDQLREIYGFPRGRAKDKVLGALEKHSIHFISKSPFLLLSTISKDGKMDVSPRGGVPGFVKVSETGELLIPDAKGNNRVDSFSNIIETGSIGLIFLLPGIDETLRINGSAYITTDPSVLDHFDSEEKTPISCLVISIDEVFLHCAKALMRSKLWKGDFQIDPKNFPSIGKMLKDQLKSPEDAESREDMIKRYQKDL